MPDIELRKIQPNRLNPRLEFTKAGLDELSDSIKQVGLLEPIIVRPRGDTRGDNTYEVVVGERRYRAAQQAGLDTVPVIIRDYTDSEVMELNLIENIQREDLSAVEKGNLCKQLREKFQNKYPSNATLARKLGIGEGAINAWLQTTGMPVEVQRRIAPETERKAVPAGKVDYATAVRIGRQVKEPAKFAEVIEHIAEKRIPRRIATQVTRQIAREPEKPIEQVFQEVIEETPIFLPFSKAHADAIAARVKTQTSRKAKDPRLQPGVTVQAQVTHFADLGVTDVYRKKLGDFDEEDARREGGYTLDEFKEVWKALHGEWNPNETVYVIRFRVARVVGEPDSSS
ncbi:Nucleoid occlusion protein [subsurface metagenome]